MKNWIRAAPTALIATSLTLLLPATPSLAARQPAHGQLTIRDRPLKLSQKQTLGSLRLGGSMSSSVSLKMTGAFSVGKATNLNWQLPLVQSTYLDGYTEHVDALKFSFNTAPDSYSDAQDALHHRVRQFHWDQPPPDQIIHVTETLKVTVQSNLASFVNGARYPLGSLASSLRPYAKATAETRLPSSANSLIKKFKKSRTEAAAVNSVANWVASHTGYSASLISGPLDASWVYRNHRAACTGYDNLMAGFLRKLGIPAQVQQGWVAPQRLTVPGPKRSTAFVQWSGGGAGELHTWLNIYFPGSGWVSFDPQREKFFVDSRHVGFLTNIDAVPDLGLGQWTAEHDLGESATGAKLSNGGYEAVPGDGSAASKVTLANSDSFSLSYRGLQHDVKNVLLLTRR